MTQAFNLAQLANNVDTSGHLNAAIGLTNTVPITNGGTGTTSALQAIIDLGVITSLTGSEIIPIGTTAQRDSVPSKGYLRFNTDLGQFEGFDGSNWTSVGGGATGGGGDQVFVENGTTITTNYTFPSGKNASTVGPVTINTGITVTVPSGQRWLVL
jgi:hypothetical protein